MNRNLLVIAPHFKCFIEDQTRHIVKSFNKATILIPVPYFSRFISYFPIVSDKYSFLRRAIESTAGSSDSIDVVTSSYLTIPIEVIRKREHFIVSQSLMSAVSKYLIRYDLIHAHFLPLGYSACRLKEKYSTPFVLTVHGSDIYKLPFQNDWYRSLARYILSQADHIITVSRFNAEKVSQLGISSRKISIIPNGFDKNMFKPADKLNARAMLRLPLDKRILLSVGNLVEVKGHIYLIEAMTKVLRSRSDVFLVIVGDGHLRVDLQRRIDALQLSRNVLLVGAKKHAEVCTWMNACDVFVLPSLSEGFATVIPEAMACGKPVIGSRVGGIPEVLNNECIGILVEPGNSELLADAIINALETQWSPDVIVELAATYSLENVSKKIVEIYKLLT